MKLTAIIVDDEENSRVLLKQRIESWHPEITICDVCDSAKEALLSIAKYHPDLLFLDIQMPEMNGLEFFRCVNSLHLPLQCIIITAHSEPEYFKNAIRLGLTDYIMKPLLKEELNGAIANATSRITAGRRSAGPYDAMNGHIPGHKIALPTATGAIYIYPDQTLYIKAAGKYSELFMQNAKETIMCGITELEEMLKENDIIRIDRSTLINKKYVEKVSLLLNKITLNAGNDRITIEVSKKGAEQMIDMIRKK